MIARLNNDGGIEGFYVEHQPQSDVAAAPPSQLLNKLNSTIAWCEQSGREAVINLKHLYEIRQLIAALPSQVQEDDRRLREYLWLSHGHSGQYGDDGEMQCGQCAPFGMFDYRREPLSRILDALDKVGQERRVKAIAEPSQAQETESTILQAVLDAIAGTLDPHTQIADHPNVKFAQMRRLELTEQLASQAQEIAGLRGHFCEAHQPEALQPDVYCPFCAAVHFDDLRIAVENELAAIRQALWGIAQEMRKANRTLRTLYVQRWADAIEAALGTPPSKQT